MALAAETEGLAPALLCVLRRALGRDGIELAEELRPLAGGFDTRIYAFRLRGAPEPLAGPLVLRLLGPHHDPRRALREQAVQNAIAAQGYPAPRAPLASADPGPLGGSFVVMERLPGRPLLDTRRVGLAPLLVDGQARLHALAVEPVLATVEAAGLGRSAITFEGYLDQLDARIRHHGLDGLRRPVAWLRDHRPPPTRAVVCHGDFHPLNLLAEGTRITGVLDWPNAVVADPAFDIASTRLILACVPLALMGTPAPLRPLIALARWVLLRAYLGRWRRRGLPDAARLAYYEAAASMRWLVRAAEARSGRSGEAAPGRLEASTFPERLAARFTRVTGVRPIITSREAS